MKKLLRYAMAACSCLVVGVAAADTTAYGYLFNSKDGKRGFVSFDVAAPQTLNLPQRDFGDVHPIAGEFVDGKVYVYRAELDEMYGQITPYDWAIYDAETNKRLDYHYTSGNRVVDMTYDYTTNTMYALVEDKSTSGEIAPTSLCVVDMSTGTYRIIGSPGELTAIDGNNKVAIDGLITLACDATGQLYAMSSYRYLYKVDKFSGAVTQAAPRHNLGTADQFQSMAFDADGRLWWAQQHPSYAHFCQIDLSTGIPGGFVDFTTDYEKLNKLGDDAQVTALYFKDKSVNGKSPLAVTDLKAKTQESNPYSVDLSWTLPTVDYKGNPVEITGVRVYCLGVGGGSLVLPADATACTYPDAPNGNLTFEVIPFNEAGNGFPAFTEVFAGMDQLMPVQNLSASIADKVVSVTWEKPDATVNGGYADYDAIVYNVYRKLGSDRTSVAEGISKTEFSEVLDAPGSYTYVVEPICGGVVGVSAESNAVKVVSVASIPYFTSFEDSQDGSLWTVINHTGNANYGWQFGIKSYEFSGKSAYAVTGGSSYLGDDWLISPPIQFREGSYTLDFYGNGASYDKVSLDACLGTDPADVNTFDNVIYSHDNDYLYDGSATPKGWKHVEAKFTVPADGVYYLGFHHKTQTTYANTRIDDVSIKAAESGVVSVLGDDADAPVEFYNLQGIKVDNPVSGLYIRRQGRTVEKVIVK